MKDDDRVFGNAAICRITSKSVKKAAEYIDQHYKEEFSVDNISDALFINKSYLMRIFKKETGVTLLQYLNITRCKKAETLLIDTDMSIESVAYEVGYVTSSHFIRIFKSIVGNTPSKYRRMSRIN